MSWAYLLFPVQCILQSTYYKTLGQWEYNRIYCLQPYLGCHSPYQTSGGHYWLGWSFSLARVSWYLQGDICNSYKQEYDHNILQNTLYQPLGKCYFNIIHCPQHQRQERNNLFFSLYYIIEFHKKTSLCGKCLNFNASGRFAVLLCYIAQSML